MSKKTVYLIACRISKLTKDNYNGYYWGLTFNNNAENSFDCDEFFNFNGDFKNFFYNLEEAQERLKTLKSRIFFCTDNLKYYCSVAEYAIYKAEMLDNDGKIKTDDDIIDISNIDIDCLLNNFPDEIIAIRKGLKKSQREISQYFDIPLRTWQEWEQKKRQPPMWCKRLILNELNQLRNVNPYTFCKE